VAVDTDINGFKNGAWTHLTIAQTMKLKSC